MYDCECPKCSNGYYHITIGIVLHWNKNFAKKHDWCWKFELKTRVYQFVWNKRKTLPESQQWDITEKISERTDRIEHTLTFGEIYNKLQTLKKIQTIVFSKYQVFNDHIHCPKIL